MKKIACISLMCAVVLIMMPRAAWGRGRGTVHIEKKVPQPIVFSPGDNNTVNVTVNWNFRVDEKPDLAGADTDLIEVWMIDQDGLEKCLFCQPTPSITYDSSIGYGYDTIRFEGKNFTIQELHDAAFRFKYKKSPSEIIISPDIPVEPFANAPWVYLPFLKDNENHIVCMGKLAERREDLAYVLMLRKPDSSYVPVSANIRIVERILDADSGNIERWLVAETTLAEAMLKLSNDALVQYVFVRLGFGFVSPPVNFIFSKRNFTTAKALKVQGNDYDIDTMVKETYTIIPDHAFESMLTVTQLTPAQYLAALDSMEIDLLKQKNGTFEKQQALTAFESPHTVTFTTAVTSDFTFRLQYNLQNYNIGHSAAAAICSLDYIGAPPAACSSPGGIQPEEEGPPGLFEGTYISPDVRPITDLELEEEGEVTAPSDTDIVTEEEVTVMQPAQADADRLMYGGGWCSIMAETSADTGVIMTFLMLFFGVLTPLSVARLRRKGNAMKKILTFLIVCIAAMMFASSSTQAANPFSMTPDHWSVTSVIPESGGTSYEVIFAGQMVDDFIMSSIGTRVSQENGLPNTWISNPSYLDYLVQMKDAPLEAGMAATLRMLFSLPSENLSSNTAFVFHYQNTISPPMHFCSYMASTVVDDCNPFFQDLSEWHMNLDGNTLKISTELSHSIDLAGVELFEKIGSVLQNININPQIICVAGLCTLLYEIPAGTLNSNKTYIVKFHLAESPELTVCDFLSGQSFCEEGGPTIYMGDIHRIGESDHFQIDRPDDTESDADLESSTGVEKQRAFVSPFSGAWCSLMPDARVTLSAVGLMIIILIASMAPMLLVRITRSTSKV